MATGNNNTQAAFLACRSNWPLCLAGQAWARLRASHPHLPHHHLVFLGSLPLPGLKEQWPPFLSLLFHGCWKFNPPSAHIFLVITIWGTGRTKNIFLRGFSYAMSPIELDFGHVASFFLFHLLLSVWLTLRNQLVLFDILLWSNLIIKCAFKLFFHFQLCNCF